MNAKKFPARKPQAADMPVHGPQLPPVARPTKGERALRTMWTIGSVLSILLNVVLFIALIVATNQLFAIKKLLGEDLLGGLYNNFVLMDQANITATIQVQDEIPINFELPIEQNTVVVLTEDTRINGARVSLSTGGLNIVSAPTNIILPAGAELPVRLKLTVPVQTVVPVTLNVPVDIPLNQTELHEPFVGLQNVVWPYYQLIQPDWQTWRDVPACSGGASFLCGAIFSDPQP